MGQNRSHQIKLIAAETSDSNVIHLALGFHFPKYLFLIPPTVMKPQHLLHGRLFVRHNHRKLITIFMGNEEIQLNRPLIELLTLLTNKQKPISAAPALGLPTRLKKGPCLVKTPPTLPLLDHSLQLDKPLKRNRKSEFHTQSIEQGYHFVTKKRTVHPNLDLHPRQFLTQHPNTPEQKRLGPMGIMNISRTMIDVKDLPRLSDGTKQGIITPGSLFLLVKTDRRPFNPPALRRTYRPIKIQRQSIKTDLSQPLDYQTPAQLADPLNTLPIHIGQNTRYRRHIGNPTKPQQTLHHRIIPVIINLSKPPVSNQKMHDQQQNDHMMAKNRRYLQMSKTSPQSFLEMKVVKQRLKNHQSCKGSQSLIFKPDFWNLAHSTIYFVFAILHLGWPPALDILLLCQPHFIQSGGHSTMI